MDLDMVRNLAASKLPAKHEPLLLTFYGKEATQRGYLVAIGCEDYGGTLYVDTRDGHIQTIDDEGQLLSRFVNSSVGQLADCMAEYESSIARRLQTSTEAEDRRLVQEFRDKLKAIDPAVFNDSENWWAVILEQQEDGIV
jgi:hypothetical protein